MIKYYKIVGTDDGMAVCPKCGNKYMCDTYRIVINPMNEEREAALICPKCRKLFLVNIESYTPKGYALRVCIPDGELWRYSYAKDVSDEKGGYHKISYEDVKKMFPQYVGTIKNREHIIFPINLADECMENWTEGDTFDFYVEVFDTFSLFVDTPLGSVLKEFQVGFMLPTILNWGEKNFSDRIILKVDKDGKILNLKRYRVDNGLSEIINEAKKGRY